jgi:dihydrofolate reductase
MSNLVYELIVAMDEMSGIGKNGVMPWYVPDDLKFFKSKTEHNIIIMGRKTFDSLPHKKPLKNRLHIVLTRKPTEECVPYSNVIYTDTIEWIHNFIPPAKYGTYLNENPIKYVVGGLEIYNLFFSQCRHLWITSISGVYDCDVFFTPPLDGMKREIIKKTSAYTVEHYTR